MKRNWPQRLIRLSRSQTWPGLAWPSLAWPPETIAMPNLRTRIRVELVKSFLAFLLGFRGGDSDVNTE